MVGRKKYIPFKGFKGRFEWVPIWKIQRNPVRENLLEKAKGEVYNTLKEDIRENGIEEPLILDENYCIIDGHTRFKIAKELEWHWLPCVIKEKKNSKEDEAFRVNIQRRRLTTPMILFSYLLANGYTPPKLPESGKSRNELAKKLGLKPTQVGEALQVWKNGTLTICRKVARKEITLEEAKRLLGLDKKPKKTKQTTLEENGIIKIRKNRAIVDVETEAFTIHIDKVLKDKWEVYNPNWKGKFEKWIEKKVEEVMKEDIKKKGGVV